MKNLIVGLFRLLQFLAPWLAGQLVVTLFFRPGRRRRRVLEPEVFASGASEVVTLDEDIVYTRYSWGQGKPVLLVHGWGGRASQFSGFLKPLLAAGYRVVSFDAPAHGLSPGSRTNLIEFGRIIEDLAKREGAFEAVLSHSLGSVATGRSALAGVDMKKLVFLGAPADIEYILDSFSEKLPLNLKTMSYLRASLLELAETSIEEFSLRESVEGLSQAMLFVHDTADRQVKVSQVEVLKNASKSGAVLLTEGLGHNGVLRDPGVVERVMSFVQS